jgi:4-amino-4-deoxy-L-arabinose transferase-like glycosyltransferase
MPGMQEWIHALEEGRGAQVLKVVLAIIGFVTLAVFYDFFCYKNFWAPEAMDSAQLARNIAEGKGYTTHYVRPLSIHLLEKHRADKDPMLKTAHPDLANAPAYPTVLAGLMKTGLFKFEIPQNKSFYAYQPELWIAAFNQVLFLIAAWMLFSMASKLFERGIAVIATLVFVGSELFWRFSISGLSTMLLVIVLLGVVWCLVLLDQWQREENPPAGKIIRLSIFAGVLTGLAALTRYSFAWLILPVLFFVALFAPRFRLKAGVIVAISFLVIVTPWIVRNCMVSGRPFGTATYAVFEQMVPFPEDTLQRSLNPQTGFHDLTLNNFGRKFAANIQNILQTDLPKLGGSWVTAFFLVSLFIPFRNPTLSRLRIFLLASLALFVMVQAGGRTKLSDVSLEVNSENLLVVFAPLIFLYGTAFYSMLLEQLQLPFLGLRQAITAIFVIFASAQLLFTLAPPKEFPAAYPPYWPPLIQRQIGGAMKPDELIMSDMPWAVAWYGNRQCVSLTLDYEKQFFAIHEKMKPVGAVYLSPITLDSPFLTRMLIPLISPTPRKTWERFLFESLARGEVLSGFPLRKLRADLLPDHFFLADTERWQSQKKK